MTPREIDHVVRSWRAACRDRDALRTAIRAQLPDGSMSPSDRTDWIIETVDRLHPLLSNPKQLTLAAIDMANQRHIITANELEVDRQALIVGIESMVGPLAAGYTTAWRRACGLFADVIAGLILNPFRVDSAAPTPDRGAGAAPDGARFVCRQRSSGPR